MKPLRALADAQRPHLFGSGQVGPLRVNTVDFEERPDVVCNGSIYRQADFRSLRSSGIWFVNLERQESACCRDSASN